MIAASSCVSMTLKVSDSSDPGAAALGVIDEEPRQIEQPAIQATIATMCSALVQG